MDTKNERTTDKSADLKNQVNLTTTLEDLQGKLSKGIHPYRVAKLFKIAEKFMSQLANQPEWLVSLDEMEYIIEIMLDAVRKAQGKVTKHGSDEM